ncbi:MAG: leucine-rich repeat protein [Bacteroidales bacterium]|nr:leucine-rich repeat protein [Bacteroidales bacterium]
MKFNTFRNAVFLALLLSGSLVAQDLPSPYSYDPSWGIDYSDGIFHYYPRDRKASTYKIPASIKVIEERAFQCNKHLTEITIPESITKIGMGAFLWSKKLRTIKGQV